MKKALLIATLALVGLVSLNSCETNSPANCDPNCNSVQCSSNTQAGARCKNMTTNCCGRCHLHK